MSLLFKVETFKNLPFTLRMYYGCLFLSLRLLHRCHNLALRARSVRKEVDRRACTHAQNSYAVCQLSLLLE